MLGSLRPWRRAPLAIPDGAELTAIRTPGFTSLAVSHTLAATPARADGPYVLVFATGVQAAEATLVLAVCVLVRSRSLRQATAGPPAPLLRAAAASALGVASIRRCLRRSFGLRRFAQTDPSRPPRASGCTKAPRQWQASTLNTARGRGQGKTCRTGAENGLIRNADSGKRTLGVSPKFWSSGRGNLMGVS
ncbi:hypothetical protein [Paenarthrobacter sp. 2TAF44]|uniref:hypothetical protein n=1 Tax=Paenarthrobacter sp. 2TAF44 TaxID=3233018 RepID=UPI003F9761FB